MPVLESGAFGLLYSLYTITVDFEVFIVKPGTSCSQQVTH